MTSPMVETGGVSRTGPFERFPPLHSMRSHCCQPDSALKLKQRMEGLRFYQKNGSLESLWGKINFRWWTPEFHIPDIFSRKICLFWRDFQPTHLNTDLEHTTHPSAKTKKAYTSFQPQTPKFFCLQFSELNNLFSCHHIHKPFLIMRAMRSWPRLRRCGSAVQALTALTGPFPLRPTLRRPLSSVASERMGTCAELGCGPSAVSGHSKSGDLLGLTNETLESDWSLFKMDRKKSSSFDQGFFFVGTFFLSFYLEDGRFLLVGVLNDVDCVMLVVCLLIGGPWVWEEEDLGWRYQTSNYSSWRRVCHKLAVRWAHVAWDVVFWGYFWKLTGFNFRQGCVLVTS